MKNRIALVTGGMGGLGTAICRALANEGARVVAAYHHHDAEAWQQKQKALGFDFAIYQCDVSDFASTNQLVTKVTEQVGPIEILVNNAGITEDARLQKMTPEQWAAVMHTNLDSMFNVTQQVLSNMITSGFGRIINISSINGQKGQFGQTNYSAAKAGVHGFTKALAQEVATKGITVNTISPGYIATEMVMAVPETIRQQIIAQIPVGRLGNPEEISRCVVFLASDNAGYITGSNLSINGGQHMY